MARHSYSFLVRFRLKFSRGVGEGEGHGLNGFNGLNSLNPFNPWLISFSWSSLSVLDRALELYCRWTSSNHPLRHRLRPHLQTSALRLIGTVCNCRT